MLRNPDKATKALAWAHTPDTSSTSSIRLDIVPKSEQHSRGLQPTYLPFIGDKTRCGPRAHDFLFWYLRTAGDFYGGSRWLYKTIQISAALLCSMARSSLPCCLCWASPAGHMAPSERTT